MLLQFKANLVVNPHKDAHGEIKSDITIIMDHKVVVDVKELTIYTDHVEELINDFVNHFRPKPHAQKS